MGALPIFQSRKHSGREIRMKYELAAFADEADGSLEGQIAAMKENGIRYLEIRGVDGQNISELSREKVKETARRLEDAGIRVWSLGSPYGKIGIEEDFGPHLNRFQKSLEDARILGASHMRIFSFYVPAGREQAYEEQVLERMGRFLEAARGSGVTLCHENEKGIFGDKALRCAGIHRALPQIRAVFDPANFIQCGQNVEEAWELLHPYVEYLHVKDALEDGSVVPAGKGIGGLGALLKDCQGMTLTLEPHLSVFPGLSGLEREKRSQMGPYCYPTGRAAFDAAAQALRELLE